MMQHPTEAWREGHFKDIVTKVSLLLFYWQQNYKYNYFLTYSVPPKRISQMFGYIIYRKARTINRLKRKPEEFWSGPHDRNFFNIISLRKVKVNKILIIFFLKGVMWYLLHLCICIDFYHQIRSYSGLWKCYGKHKPILTSKWWWHVLVIYIVPFSGRRKVGYGELFS